MSFAIVTPSYNKARYLPYCLQSVLSQQEVEMDYWVLDNCSTDGSAEILRQAQERYPGKVHALIEPDEGQAFAINKGFSLAKGEIMCWLNADDFYFPQTLMKVERFFRDHPEIDLLYGQIQVLDENLNLIHVHSASPPDLNELKKIDFIPQPAAFWRRSVWEAVGPLDDELNWGFDWDFFIRAFQRARAGFIPEPLAGAVWAQDIKTRTGGIPRVRELSRIARRYDDWTNPTFLYCCYLLMIYRLAQPLLRRRATEMATREMLDKLQKYTVGALRRLHIRVSV
jgi:glycosyltransferase involved in cell wall biosynthesis